jgi:hypothetical protein
LFPIHATERSHIGDLLSGTDFEPTESQKIILEGMNPVWKYLVILEFKKKYRSIVDDMRLANFKVNPDKNLRKVGRGWAFVKKKSKNDFDIDNRIPINFRPRKWIITQQQINNDASYIEINRVPNETKIIEEKLKEFGDNYDGIIDYLFKNWLVIQNLQDALNSEVALKISIYATYYAYKLKDFKLMETITEEQSKRKWNGFTVLTRFYTINKFSKTGLATFKAK